MKTANSVVVGGIAALLAFGAVARAQAVSAPASMAGKAVLIAIQSGTGPFEAGKGFAVAPAASGSGFTLVGVEAAPLVAGTYTYSTDGGVNGSMAVNLGPLGRYQLSLHFVSDYRGTFALDGTGGSASGDFTYFSVPVPASLQSTELDLTPDPNTGAGTGRVVTSVSGSSYTMTGPSGSVEGQGTYAYARVNPCLGKLAIHDSVSGNSTAFFGLYQGNTGLFGIQGSGTSDIVTCVLVDRQGPSVTIASPAANARLLQLPVQVQGTAADNSRIASVTYTVQNANGTSGVLTAAGTTNWSATIPAPAPGTNLVTITAIDVAGNRSAPVSRVFTYVASSALTLHSTGAGSFRPSLDGQFLEIGKSYTITAQPGSGYIFAGWTGQLTSASPTLTFSMTPNLVLAAAFVANPFPAVAGTYNGMVSPSGAQPSGAAPRLAADGPAALGAEPSTLGAVTVSVTAKGTYSGTVRLGSATYAVSGQFSAAGLATRTIARKGTTPLTLNLQLGLNGEDLLVGSIGDGSTWTHALSAQRCIYTTKRPTPLAGYSYTFVVPTAQETGSPNGPTGYAYGTVSISGSGIVKVSGSLADGTPITLGTTLAKDGSWALCLPLYKGAGILAGWLNSDTTMLSGTLRWARPADAAARYYAEGFDFQAEIVSSRYVRNATAILGFTNGLVQFSGGNLTQAFANHIELVAGSKVLNRSANQLTLTFTRPSGLFSGTVTPPGATRAVPFKGVVLQNSNEGAGYILGTNAVGAVFLSGAP